MSHHPPSDQRDVIKVRWTGTTFKATIDGDSTTCTASAKMAATRLAASVMAVAPDQVSLRELEEAKRGHYKFEITDLN
jgi:hypothetical protein